MKIFKWLLNWSVNNVHIKDNESIPVWRNGGLIGRCTISVEGNKIIGSFDLDEDLDNSLYILYTVSLPNSLNELYLEGIQLVDYYDGLEKRARKAENMFQ
jgi:hypothetical protein